MKKKNRTAKIVWKSMCAILLSACILGTGRGAAYANAYVEGREYTHNARFSNSLVRNGIDVSKHQKEVDWNAVRASGIDFAIIRVGNRSSADSGVIMSDEYFDRNVQGALAAGLEVGVYIFSQAITEAEAIEEAEYALARVAGYNITLPIVMDYEYVGSKGRLYKANLGREESTRICNAFARRISEAGYTPMIYANKNWLETKLNAAEISQYAKIWLAHYTKASYTSYTGEYEFWQYSSSGRVNGINGSVDMNFWYDTKKELENGIYTISSAADSRMMLDIAEGSDAETANLQIYERNGAKAQQFVVTNLGSDLYKIMSLSSGKYLDAEGGNPQMGTNICQFSWNNGENQKWYIRYIGNDYYNIVSACDELYVDVEDGRMENFSNVRLWEGNGAQCQKFKFEALTPTVNRNYNGWYEYDGARYWFDYGVLATDKEVYDPLSDAWYWFDADGIMAANKDVFIPSNPERTEGKWVRYDENGGMIKGEDFRYGGWYWFDPITGEMYKGFINIPDGTEDGKWVYYDPITGQMHHGECYIDGERYYFDDVTGEMQ